MLILGGDFNVPLTPLLDTSNGSSSLTYRALRAIKSQLSLLSLHDSWRTLNPNTKDFTFFSPMHNKYSRIDHLFITQNDLTLLSGATIEPMLLSDHHPITMTLTWQGRRPTSKIWRMDDSILLDLVAVDTLTSRLTQYFDENDSGDVAPANSLGCPQMCHQRGNHL